MSQNLKSNDRIETDSGQTGTIKGVSFNSIEQEWEYYVLWDAFPEKGECNYKVDDVKDLWQKIDDIAEALPRGYVNQDPDAVFKNQYLGEFPKEKKECDHKWVDIGFTRSKIICKICDMEQK